MMKKRSILAESQNVLSEMICVTKGFFSRFFSFVSINHSCLLNYLTHDDGEREEEEAASEEAREASFCHTYLISRDGSAQKAERKRDARLRLEEKRTERGEKRRNDMFVFFVFGFAICLCRCLSILGSFEPS